MSEKRNKEIEDALKRLASVISLDTNYYPDAGAYRQVYDAVNNAKRVLKRPCLRLPSRSTIKLLRSIVRSAEEAADGTWDYSPPDGLHGIKDMGYAAEEALKQLTG